MVKLDERVAVFLAFTLIRLDEFIVARMERDMVAALAANAGMIGAQFTLDRKSVV